MFSGTQSQLLIFVLYRYDNIIHVADDGKKLEKELNDKGPGEAY